MQGTQNIDMEQHQPARNMVAVDLQTNTVKWEMQAPTRSSPLLEAPLELPQTIMDLLPTFEDRIRMCRTCKLAYCCLEWRLGPPLELNEEMSNLNLKDIGAQAVALSLVTPLRAPLGELALGNNGIGNDGATAISKVLIAGCSLRRLSLRDNSIGDSGVQALALALATNTPLQELDIWNNPMSSASKAALLASARCKVFIEPGVPMVQPAPWLRLAGGRLRAVLFEWISQVHTGGHAPVALDGHDDPQDLLFRTFCHLDTYFSCRPVRNSELQLMGVACTLAASVVHVPRTRNHNHEEVAAWLSFVLDGACTPQEIKQAAKRVMTQLGHQMHQPTVYTFLRRYLRKTGWTQESFSLANYLIELAVMDGAFCQYAPQVVAAAATILSRQYVAQGISFQSVPDWRTKLLKCLRLDVVSELAPCAAALSKLHVAVHGRSHRFVNKKYMWSRLHSVAKVKPNPPADASHFVAFINAEAD